MKSNVPTNQEALEALIRFMGEQMKLNRLLRKDSAVLKAVLLKPEFDRRFAQRHTCVSAIV